MNNLSRRIAASLALAIVGSALSLFLVPGVIWLPWILDPEPPEMHVTRSGSWYHQKAFMVGVVIFVVFWGLSWAEGKWGKRVGFIRGLWSYDPVGAVYREEVYAIGRWINGAVSSFITIAFLCFGVTQLIVFLALLPLRWERVHDPFADPFINVITSWRIAALSTCFVIGGRCLAACKWWSIKK